MNTTRIRPLHRLFAAGAALALLALSGCVAYPGPYYGEGAYYGGPYYAPSYGYAYGGPSVAFNFGGGGHHWHHWR
jgi:hypothetical protein